MTVRLIEDIKVVGLGARAADRPWIADRLRLNGGVDPCSGPDPGCPYRPGGFLPKEDWCAPSEQEIGVLTDFAGLSKASHTVRLVEAPAALLELGRRLGLSRMTHQGDVQRLAIGRSGEFSEFKAQAKAFGESLLDRREGFSSQSVRCESHTGLRSSTLDQKSGRYVGLHIDDWDRLPMRARENSRSRLILNLGEEPRFVVFINLSVSTMARMVASAVETGSQEEAFDRLGDFFLHFGSYPVTRLRVDPGEAYIAPVDNLFHDGTTIAKQAADVTHSMLGHFR
jgi:hypothetical protein